MTRYVSTCTYTIMFESIRTTPNGTRVGISNGITYILAQEAHICQPGGESATQSKRRKTDKR